MVGAPFFHRRSAQRKGSSAVKKHENSISTSCFVSFASLWLNSSKSGTERDKLSQTYETILVEHRERVALITINRPEKRNALNIQTRREGAAVLDELRANDSVRVVVITGAGDKAFIAGADIAEFAERTAIQQREVMLDRSLFNAIDGFPKPIIAMVNGYCLGGGCEVALACDLRIASERASFGQPETNLGIIPGGGGTQRLTRLVGEGKAMELILTGEIIDAHTAFMIGLANH